MSEKSKKAPCEYHPDLTQDRLEDMARFFANVAKEVAAEHQPEKGDDAWALGCRRNAWWRNRMLDIEKSGDWPWFHVMSRTKGFVFMIGMVPIRFYRGRHGRPPNNTLAIRHDELRQLSLAFEDSEYGDLKWRFSIETGYDGRPVGVVFSGLRADGSCDCYWQIPFEGEVTSLPDSIYAAPEAVEIDPPEVDAPPAVGKPKSG